jgi:hypothetical protein
LGLVAAKRARHEPDIEGAGKRRIMETKPPVPRAVLVGGTSSIADRLTTIRVQTNVAGAKPIPPTGATRRLRATSRRWVARYMNSGLVAYAFSSRASSSLTSPTSFS